MPNLFAYAVLLCWPAVALWLFATRSLARAILWTFVGGYLLLPAGTSIKFEMVPSIDKNSISIAAAVLGCFVIAHRLPRVFCRFGLEELLILMFVFTPFITSSLMGDSITIGPRTIAGEP